MNRSEQLRRLREEEFDVLVIGGGITGAAAARDAASRGFRTALVEARDFGEGTSSRSSRLVHGGLRYLEQFEFDLVFEASRERRTLLRIAPHLVRPLEFLFPIYREGRVGKLKLDAGMWLYDALSLFRNIERHQMLDADELASRAPGLRTDGLLGGARFFDAQVDDARLVILTTIAAAEEGAAVANRLETTRLLEREGKVVGARVASRGAGDAPNAEFDVAARVVLNATGPWTDATLQLAGIGGAPMMRPTRGTHIHVPRERVGHDRAFIFESPLDGRIMFVLPWRDLTLIGTTDEDYQGRPEDVVPTADDVGYLLESSNSLFPEAALAPQDVISAWAGLRPLVAEEGATSEDDVSREHVIRETPPGLLTIAGGKLTSHRAMAQDVVDHAARALAELGIRGGDSKTEASALPGGDFANFDELTDDLRRRGGELGLPEPACDRLARAYGTRAERVLEIVRDEPGLGDPIVDGRPNIAGEVTYAVRAEAALHAEDVAFRRTHVGLETGPDCEPALSRVAELMGEELGWTGDRVRAEVERAAVVRERNEEFRTELEAQWRSEPA